MDDQISIWQATATKVFPYSAKARLIYGDGKYALVSKCGKRWRVLLYQTPEARSTKMEVWRCCSNCVSDHSVVDLSI